MDDRTGPRIDVLIVNYRAYDELERCLGSLEPVRSTFQQVIVVDHESDPASASHLAARFPWVTLIAGSTNAGFAVGVNTGARATSAPYILLLNPDCVLDPQACGTLTSWMDAHADVAVAGPRIRNADGTVQPSARRFPDLTTAIAGRSSWLTRVLPQNPFSRRNLPARDISASAPVEVDWVSGACMLVRRDAFDAVGGMDEGFFLYWEDADFCRRLEHAGWRTCYVPEAAVMHIGGRSSRHAADASLEAFHRSAYRLYCKHAGRAGRLLSPLVFAGLQVRLAFMKRLVRRKHLRSDPNGV
ncbi:MAG TPA: glycosyltransferase family 2 protein [Vicinamibacterales bacterium]|nr:glycosyltransferase family 2 protein [Vicinamibacterales bacterium]